MGKSKTTSSPQIPKELQELYGLQTEFAKGGFPDFQNLVYGVMRGDDSKTLPYMRGMFAPYERAGQRAAEMTRRQTPRGGAQDAAIAETMRDVALERGSAEAQMLQDILALYAQIMGGFDPQAQIGQKQTHKDPLMLSFGDFASVPIG